MTAHGKMETQETLETHVVHILSTFSKRQLIQLNVLQKCKLIKKLYCAQKC